MLTNILILFAATQTLVSAVPLNSSIVAISEQSTSPSAVAVEQPSSVISEPSTSSSAAVVEQSSPVNSEQNTSLLAVAVDQASSVSASLIASTPIPSSGSITAVSSAANSTAPPCPEKSGVLSPPLGPNGAGFNSSQLPGNSSFGLGAIHTGNGTSSGLGAVSAVLPTSSTGTIAPPISTKAAASVIIPAPEVLSIATVTASEKSSTAAITAISPSSVMASPASASTSTPAHVPIAATSAVFASPAAAFTGSLGASHYYSLANVDECQLPLLDAFPVTTWPLDSDGLPEQEPSIGLWFALSMDEWLDETFRLCPAALDTRTTLSDGDELVPFSVVLARLMFGMKDGAYSAITCNQNRCTWNNGEGWSRGDMFPSDSRPCIGLSSCSNNTNTNLEFVEKLRRWYTLQALGNVWDHKKAVAAAMGPAQQAVSGRMEQMMNAWSPTFVAAKWNPPKSPFSAIFDIFKGVANFIPVAGPAISSALNAVNVVFPDAAGTKKPAKSDETALADDKNLQAVKDAIVTQAKGIAGAVTLAFQVSGDIKEALKDGEWTPEHWDPVFDISGADSMAKFSAAFASMAAGLGKVFDDSINGPPNGPNGFLTLVKGGLYSTSSMNPDKMQADSLANLIPLYVAWTEDKLLQAIMRSYGIFFMHTTHSSQGECESQALAEVGNWAGAYCFPAADGSTWRSLTPYTSNFGYTEVYKNSNFHESYDQKQILYQTWPHMTADNVRDKLRGDTSRAEHPIDITQVYQRLAQCFDATNANVNHRPSPHGSTTGYINFPPAIETSSASPLEAVCHWNLPVVDRWPHPADGPDSTACVDQYDVDGRQWSFWVDPRDHRMNDIHESCLLKAQGRVTRTFCGIWERGVAGCGGFEGRTYTPYDGRPGPVLYYARALAYPVDPDCVLNTDHIACSPF